MDSKSYMNDRILVSVGMVHYMADDHMALNINDYTEDVSIDIDIAIYRKSLWLFYEK